MSWRAGPRGHRGPGRSFPAPLRTPDTSCLAPKEGVPRASGRAAGARLFVTTESATVASFSRDPNINHCAAVGAIAGALVLPLRGPLICTCSGETGDAGTRRPWHRVDGRCGLPLAWSRSSSRVRMGCWVGSSEVVSSREARPVRATGIDSGVHLMYAANSVLVTRFAADSCPACAEKCPGLHAPSPATSAAR